LDSHTISHILSTSDHHHKQKIILAMLARTAARALSAPSSRLFSTSAARQTKVAVLGAGGGIGQPLSLLLKAEPLVSSLSLYDIRGAPGVAADVSHVDTASEVRLFYY
jgi:malate dehydrogenase